MSGELFLLIRIIVVKFQRDIASVSRSGERKKRKKKKKKEKKKRKAGKTSEQTHRVALPRKVRKTSLKLGTILSSELQWYNVLTGNG